MLFFMLIKRSYNNMSDTFVEYIGTNLIGLNIFKFAKAAATICRTQSHPLSLYN